MIVGSPFWSDPTMSTRHAFTSAEWILKIKVTLLLHCESLTSPILAVVHRLSSWVWLLIAPLAWQVMSEAPSNSIRAHHVEDFQVSFCLILLSPVFKLCDGFSNGIVPSNSGTQKKVTIVYIVLGVSCSPWPITKKEVLHAWFWGFC